MRHYIAHSKPHITQADIAAVTQVISTGNLSTSNEVNEFVSEMCNYTNRAEGIATNSGTNALALSLIALNLKANDSVGIPSYCCDALLHAINFCGDGRIKPIVVDINRDDYNMSLEGAKKAVNSGAKALIVPHMFGTPVKDIEDMKQLGVPIIEDCALSVGASLNNQNVGSFGTLSTFSFYTTKMMTTGHGGMVLTSDATLANRLRDLQQYDNREFDGQCYNFRMTDFQAALGREQLSRLDWFIKRRKEIATEYDKVTGKNHKGIAFRYIIETDDVSGIQEKMLQEGIETARPVFKPIHQYLNLNDDHFVNTLEVFNRALSIPIYPSLTQYDLNRVCTALGGAL